MAADRIIFDKAGGLVLEAVSGATPPVAATVAMLGNAPTVVLPLNPTVRQAAAALTIVDGRGDSVITTANGTNAGEATEGVIKIFGSGAPALQSFGQSTLAIGGRDPAGAARGAFGHSAILPDTTMIGRISMVEPSNDDLTLADLGTTQSPVKATSRTPRSVRGEG